VVARDAEYERRRKKSVQENLGYSVAQEQRHRRYMKKASLPKRYDK
jgi:hypothetical protein